MGCSSRRLKQREDAQSDGTLSLHACVQSLVPKSLPRVLSSGTCQIPLETLMSRMIAMLTSRQRVSVRCITAISVANLRT